MSYNYDANRPMKEIPRNMVWDMVEGVAETVLLFPGRDCKDLKLGLELGKVNEDTEFVLFEREEKVAKEIRKTCKKLGLKNYEVIEEDFSKVSDATFNKHFGNLFDLAFFDFCGELNWEVFSNLSHWGGADKVAMTFATQYRNNGFYNRNSSYRRGFKLPKGAMQLCESDIEKAKWSCDTALVALGAKSDKLVNFFQYKDGKNSVPMVFFTLDMHKEKDKDPNSPGNRAVKTRKYNSLVKQYNEAISTGIKAKIKREMNQMVKDFPFVEKKKQEKKVVSAEERSQRAKKAWKTIRRRKKEREMVV